MTVESRYREAFARGLSVEIALIVEDLKYQDIENWDSIGHMGLVAELEDEFSVSFSTDDIVNLDSYETGKRILSELGVTEWL